MAVAKKCKHCGEWIEKEKATQVSTQQEVLIPASQREPSTFKKKLLTLIVPITATTIFIAALVIFHSNYSYTDWWIDEGIIIWSAIGIFSLLMCTYFIFVIRKLKVIIPKGSILKSKSTKIALGIIGTVAIIACGVLLHYNRVGKQKELEAAAIKAHNDSISNFEEKAWVMKTKAMAVRRLSHLIFYDIHKNWSSAIFRHRAYNTNNTSVICNDFNNAIQWRMEFYRKEGAFNYLDKWLDEMKNDMDIINNPPEEKYKLTSEKLNELYYSVSKCVSFCKSPEGNLSSFGVRSSSLTQDIDDKIQGIDLLVKNDNEEMLASGLYSDALTDEMSSYIDNVLVK